LFDSLAFDGRLICEFRTRQELADDMNVDPQIVVGDRPEKDTRSPWVATTALT